MSSAILVRKPGWLTFYGNDADNTFTYIGTPLITGVDQFDGRDGSDTADFSELGAAVWVNLTDAAGSAWTQDDGNATDDPTAANPWRNIASLNSIENLVGTEQVDYMSGNSADNTFFYNGSFTYTGIEEIFGEGGTDTVNFDMFDLAVWVDLAFAGTQIWTQDDSDATNASGTFREIAVVDQIENIIGTSRSDLIRMDAGANVINGGNGDDDLYGRGGLDTFVFEGDNFGRDQIFDFSANDGEKIDLSDVDEIFDFSDLLNNHLVDDGGTAVIEISAFQRISLEGYSTADVGIAGIISAFDFIF